MREPTREPIRDKPLAWLAALSSPPLSAEARQEAGFLLRRLQQGERLAMPHSRPMPSVGPRCHELRIDDGPHRASWRNFYRIDDDAIVLLEVVQKTTQATPKSVIDRVKQRLKDYDRR